MKFQKEPVKENLDNSTVDFRINEIKIENLNFRYNKNIKNNIFENFSLDIKRVIRF